MDCNITSTSSVQLLVFRYEAKLTSLIQTHTKSECRASSKAQGCGAELSSITKTTGRIAHETIRILEYIRVYFHSR